MHDWWQVSALKKAFKSWLTMTLVVRSAGDPMRLVRAVAEVDRNLPIFNIKGTGLTRTSATHVHDASPIGYGGKFIRRIRSWNLSSDRRLSISGFTFRKNNQNERS